MEALVSFEAITDTNLAGTNHTLKLILCWWIVLNDIPAKKICVLELHDDIYCTNPLFGTLIFLNG